MKNSICFYFIFLFSVFLFSQCIFAQKNITPMRFNLYAGASLPEGDFSSIHGEKAGFANAGFCGLIEGSKFIGESVTWVSSVSLSSYLLLRMFLVGSIKRHFGVGRELYNHLANDRFWL